MASRSKFCKEHHREYVREHYKENKQYYVDKATRAKREVIALVNELKSNPCTDCGKTYPPYIMDFDHLNPNFKVGHVSALTSYGKKRVLEEIAKCELVCANCHRERTHRRRESTEEVTIDE